MRKGGNLHPIDLFRREVIQAGHSQNHECNIQWQIQNMVDHTETVEGVYRHHILNKGWAARRVNWEIILIKSSEVIIKEIGLSEFLALIQYLVTFVLYDIVACEDII